jgi:hypothetical protein
MDISISTATGSTPAPMGTLVGFAKRNAGDGAVGVGMRERRVILASLDRKPLFFVR